MNEIKKSQFEIEKEKFLISFYLDWINNYLTPKKMASDYSITEKEANKRINNGRKLFNKLNKKS